MLIEISKDVYLKKDSIIGISKSVIPDSNILNAGKPCVLITYLGNNEYCTYRCFSSDITHIDKHFNWLISLFETVSLPDDNPFSGSK